MSKKERMSKAGEFEHRGWIIVIDFSGEVTAYDTDFLPYYFSNEKEAIDFIDKVEGI